MDAVLAPGLGERFEFEVGRFAAGLAVVGLDRLHLVEREEQVRLARELAQRVVVEVAQRHVAKRKRPHRRAAKHVARAVGLAETGEADLFDAVVGEDSAGDEFKDGVGGTVIHETACRTHRSRRGP